MFQEYNLPNIDEKTERASLLTKEGENAIVCSHLKLVLSISRSYKHVKTNRVSYDDIVQEGVLGLYDALRKFDSSRGIRFATFARPYIKNSIKRYLRDNSHFLSIPKRTLWELYRLKRFISEHPESNEFDMCSYLNTDICKINTLLALIDHCECGPIEDRSDRGFIFYESSKKNEQLNSLIFSLDKKEKSLLSMREIQGMSWREIGEELNLSHEAVRKRYIKIVDKLRKNADALSKGI